MPDSKNYVTHTEENGAIHISDEVLSAIAAAATQEVDGVSGLSANFGSDFAERLGKKTPVGKGVRVVMEDNKANVSLSILMTYGHKINEVGAAVQESVATAIESMAGLTVASVNVNVAGMVFPQKV